MKDNKSLIEIAIEMQSKSEEKTTFIDLFNKVCQQEELTEEEKNNCIAQFYTDVVSSGDFVYCGEDLWDLKSNLKIEALDSEFYAEHAGSEGEIEEKPAKKQSRRKKKVVKMEDDDNVELVNAEDLVDDSEEDITSEDEGYENITDDYDSNDDSDDDFNYDSDDDDEDDFDEDRYNSIMDQYEDQY